MGSHQTKEDHGDSTVNLKLLNRKIIAPDDEYWVEFWNTFDLANRLKMEVRLEEILKDKACAKNIEIILTQAVGQILELISDTNLVKDFITEGSNCVDVICLLITCEKTRDLVQHPCEDTKAWANCFERYGNYYDNTSEWLVSMILRLCFCAGICGPKRMLWENGLICEGFPSVGSRDNQDKQVYAARQYTILKSFMTMLDHLPCAYSFVSYCDAPYIEELIFSLVNVVLNNKTSDSFRKDAMSLLIRMFTHAQPGAPPIITTNVWLQHSLGLFQSQETIEYLVTNLSKRMRTEPSFVALFQVFLEINERFMSQAATQQESYLSISMLLTNQTDKCVISQCAHALSTLIRDCKVKSKKAKFLSSSFVSSTSRRVSGTSSLGETIVVVCLRRLHSKAKYTPNLVDVIHCLLVSLENVSISTGEVFVDHLVRPDLFPILIRCASDVICNPSLNPCLCYAILRRTDKIRRLCHRCVETPKICRQRMLGVFGWFEKVIQRIENEEKIAERVISLLEHFDDRVSLCV